MSAISAKAVNSTLGTENFKGLDELLLEPKGLRPSDNILFLLSSTKNYTFSKGSRVFLASLTPKISGGVKILLSDSGGGDTEYGYSLQIYRNNSLDKEIVRIHGSKNEIYYKMYLGDTYEFYLYSNYNNGGTVKCAAICADTVNLPAIF